MTHPYCKYSMRALVFLSMLLFLNGVAGRAEAQLPPQTENTEESPEAVMPEWPADSLGRRNPRGTVYGFIQAVSDSNYTRAAQYVHFSQRYNNQRKARVVVTLHHLLDQSGNIMPYSWISDEPGGRLNDDLAPDLDQVGTLEVNGETIALMVEETKDAEGAPVWLISAETVKTLATLRVTHELLPVNKILPQWLEQMRWAGVAAGQWLILVILAVVAYLIARALTAIAWMLIPKIWPDAAGQPTAGIIRAFGPPVRLCVALGLFLVAGQQLGISIIIRQRFSDATVVFGLAVLLLLLWRLNDFITAFTEKRLASRRRPSALSAVLFFRRVAKIAIVAFGIIFLLTAIGVDITTGLAALGIGGLALALGAQKSIENFVGSVMLIADQSIRVGDFCKVGDTLGTVEAIGMRSTSIRTLDQTIVSIPNGELSSNTIENFSPRKKYRFFSVLGLRYETTPDQMRYVLVEIRAIFYAHPKVDPDPARIRFIELGSTSLNLEIFAYINARDFDDFMEIREDLFLRIMDVVKESGTGFALPSQTLYLARDKGVSEEKKKHAEANVRQWRKNGEMQIPGFVQSRINELRNSLDYPPKGSAIQNENGRPSV